MRRLAVGLGLASLSSLALVVACSGTDTGGVGGDDDIGSDASGLDHTIGEPTDGSPDDDGGGRDGGTSLGNTDPCDDGLAIYGNATQFARAIGICSNVTKDGYGLVSARFTTAYVDGDGGVGTALDPALHQFNDAGTSPQAGVLPRFGNVLRPREGSALGVLSSGYAGQYDELDDGGANDGGPDFGGTGVSTVHSGITPPGFPKATPGCEQSPRTFDMVDAKVTLKAPPGAHGFAFDFAFYGSDWPRFVCSKFNDAFVAYVRSSATSGANLVADEKGRPISVNASFFDRCTPDSGVGCGSAGAGQLADAGLSWSCNAGTAELGGTGYGKNATGCPNTTTSGGATGWLTATAPVTPGETFTIDFMVWDAEDTSLDSTALLDHFHWLAETTVVSTTRAK